jgi:hypothetical protein
MNDLTPYEFYLIILPLINDYIPSKIKTLLLWLPMLKFSFTTIKKQVISITSNEHEEIPTNILNKYENLYVL